MSRGFTKEVVWPQQEKERRQVEKVQWHLPRAALGSGRGRGGSRVFDMISFCSGAEGASM